MEERVESHPEPFKQEDRTITKKDLKSVFWRSFTLQGSFNYERMQSLGFLYSMLPILKRLYPDKEELKPAIKRHMQFFNTTPAISTFIMGIAGAMEKKNEKEKTNFDPTSINSIKVALMGPLAGIGDSFFWGTFRVISAGIGISLAQQGSILGAILFLVLFNIPHLIARYYGTFLGFNKGTSLLDSLYESGNMEKISYAAGILGLIVIGAMSGTLVDVSTPLTFALQGTEVNLQEILDEVVPNLLPLGITLGLLYFLKKGVKVNYLMLGILVVGILGTLIGVL